MISLQRIQIHQNIFIFLSFQASQTFKYPQWNQKKVEFRSLEQQQMKFWFGVQTFLRTPQRFGPTSRCCRLSSSRSEVRCISSCSCWISSCCRSLICMNTETVGPGEPKQLSTPRFCMFKVSGHLSSQPLIVLLQRRHAAQQLLLLLRELLAPTQQGPPLSFSTLQPS